ncbi:MAG: hypothetical protein E6590_06710 [Clostridiales bacterium]|nr:hypothetical protein [Clostridiales bacterium]
MLEGWKYYNHALLPETPPHKNPDIQQLRKRGKWDKGVLFARYTTEFDCGYETEWWYLIKDNEIDLSKLKSKRRYEITKGLKNCDVKKISPRVYAKEIYEVYNNAFENYKNAGQSIEKEKFISSCEGHETTQEIEYWGAFDKETQKLVGYALNHVYEEYVNFTTMKFDPQYLSKAISAALVYTMIVEYLNVKNKKYINDGERSIRHDTNFQDYLVKYFEFRKAYCKLNVEYKNLVKLVVNILYPFRAHIQRFPENSITHNINSLLQQESIRRSFN